MNLTHRLGCLEDFDAWYEPLVSFGRESAHARETLRHQWEVILQAQPHAIMIVEDTPPPQSEESAREVSRRVVALALTVFITKDYANWVKSGEEPWVNASVIRPLPDGSAPLLSMKDIAKANATGSLIALTTRYQKADNLTRSEDTEVRLFMFYAYMSYYRGYRFNELLMESTGLVARDSALNAGFKQRTDYSPYYRLHPPIPPDDQRPFLMGLTRTEAEEEESTMASYLFFYTPPRLGLTPAQKELLFHSLLGMSDEAFSRKCGITLNAVKGRWRATFARIERVDATLLPEGSYARRGKEKRSALLHYLRDHLEELRPAKK